MMRYRVVRYRMMCYCVMSATVETIESEVKVWTKRTLSTLRCAESPLRRHVPYLVSAVQRDHVGPLSDQHGRGDGRVVFQGLERGESGWDWVRLAGPVSTVAVRLQRHTDGSSRLSCLNSQQPSNSSKVLQY